MQRRSFVADLVTRPLLLMVGVTGFEPATLCSQSRCATKLRYTPELKHSRVVYPPVGRLARIKLEAARGWSVEPCLDVRFRSFDPW